MSYEWCITTSSCSCHCFATEAKDRLLSVPGGAQAQPDVPRSPSHPPGCAQLAAGFETAPFHWYADETTELPASSTPQ